MEQADRQPIREQHIEQLCRLWRVLDFGGYSDDPKGASSILRELSPVAIGVICLVARKPDIILREISSELALPKTTLTSLIDRMEQRGFLHRTINPRDRRSYGLELTELGRQVQQEQAAYERRVCERILGALDIDDEREQFLGLLRKIAGGI